MASKTGNKSLATVYAHALYEAAEQAGVLEQVTAELKMLRVLVHKAPKLEKLLISPTVSFNDKRKVIEGTFTNLSKITRNFLLVLVDKKRAGLLDLIAETFAEVANEKSGVAAVEVQTARTLEADEREKLQALLTKKLSKKVNLNEKVRPELLGGMVLLHEDKMWDASLAHSLKEAVGRLEGLKLQSVKWGE